MTDQLCFSQPLRAFLSSINKYQRKPIKLAEEPGRPRALMSGRVDTTSIPWWIRHSQYTEPSCSERSSSPSFLLTNPFLCDKLQLTQRKF